MLSRFCNSWDSFFHGKAGTQGCRIAGYMRIGFAAMFLIDRLVLLYHLDYFFSPSHGLLPYRVSRKNYQIADWHQWSIFRYAPESNALVWTVALLGMLQGTILLLGTSKYPRIHLFGIYLNMLSFQNHNKVLWDGQDDMFRIWCLLFLFFPLDCCTIYDRFGSSGSGSSGSGSSGSGSCSSLSSTSWPMWPFRIFQIEVMLIYTGASLGKLSIPRWQDGSSIYRLTYGKDDYPGVFNPDIIFDRYGPLKLMCWSALFLEGVCWITVWIPVLRKLSVALMILLHIGIDLSMQMHMFEWLSCLGWCVFLIQPTPTTENRDDDDDGDGDANGDGDAFVGADKDDTGNVNNEIGSGSDRTNTQEPETSPEHKHKHEHEHEHEHEQDSNTTRIRTSFRVSFLKKTLINIFVVGLLFGISVDIVPFKYLKFFLPKSFHPSWRLFVKKRNSFMRECIDPIWTRVGLSQDGDWSMYTNVEATIQTFRIDALLTNRTLVEGIWRYPDERKARMSNWKRKFYTRHSNYYNTVGGSRNELEHLIKLRSGPFMKENDNLEALVFVYVYWNHKDHEMESTGGFWDPVVKHPMDVRTEEQLMVLRIVDGNFKIIKWKEPDDDDDDDDDGYDEEVFKYGDDEDDDEYDDEYEYDDMAPPSSDEL